MTGGRGLLILALSAPAFAAACAHAPNDSKPKPGWAAKGGGVFIDGERRVLHGVGFAPSRASADEKARNDLAREIRAGIDALTREYKSATTADASATPDFSREYLDWLRDFSGGLAKQANISDRWTEPATGRMYALAELDGASVLREFERSAGIGAAMKNFAPGIWVKILDQEAAR